MTTHLSAWQARQGIYQLADKKGLVCGPSNSTTYRSLKGNKYSVYDYKIRKKAISSEYLCISALLQYQQIKCKKIQFFSSFLFSKRKHTMTINNCHFTMHILAASQTKKKGFASSTTKIHGCFDTFEMSAHIHTDSML